MINYNKIINITLSNMNSVHSLKNKGEKITLFALLYASQLFADQEGTFSIAYASLAKIIDMSEEHIKGYVIPKLSKMGYVEYVSKNKLKPISEVKNRKYSVHKECNKYKLLLEGGEDVIYSFEYSKNLIDHFYNCYRICYEQYGFDISVRFKKALREHGDILLK